ncbi:MAG TPA: response regulator [Patescibacteria group bacterium]|nr:response regulator [Patescibacteria group bacterium]
MENNNNSIKKLLIVEDDTKLQDILKEKLVAAGLNVDQALNGQQAFSKIKSEKYDLILIDIMLPGGVNGFDVLEQIKANPVLKEVPVIVLTNLDTEQKTALDIGAVDYIVKASISLDEVILKIKSHLH